MSEEKEELAFDLDLEEVPVKLKRDGKIENYILRALDGANRDAHLNDSTSRVKFKEGHETINNFKGLQADLVARGLFKDDNTPVTINEVQAFPAVVIEALYDRLRDMSGLSDPDDDDDGGQGNDD